MKKSILFVIGCSLFFMGASICEAGAVQDFIICKMCERNERNYVPSQMLLTQSKIDAFVNNSFILNRNHNGSVYRILFLYYLFDTIGGNNPIPILIRRILDFLQLKSQEFINITITTRI